MDLGTVTGIIERGAELFPDKTAFISLSGNSHSFGDLLKDSLFIGAELTRLGLDGRPAAIIGEVGYGGIAAMFGSLAAGCPFIPLHHGLSVNDICDLIARYEIGVLFTSSRFSETAELLMQRIPELTVITGIKKLLASADKSDPVPPSSLDPSAPAFLFRTADNNGIILSHKNICAALASIDSLPDISSYTFLSPAQWGEAFDCVMGLLLPLSAGCTIVQRGEKRTVSKAISESGATALTCTYQRLRNLERSIRFRSEQKRGKAATALSNILGRLGLISDDPGKHMQRRARRLMGGNLRLIICGGAYPERDSVRRFRGWGMAVCSCYFTPECGPLALDVPTEKRLRPLAELSIPSPVRENLGELYVHGDRIPIGYFGGKTEFESGFPTGDAGTLLPDGTLELRGRRKTMLYDRNGDPLFPEELAAVIRKNRYVSDCVITGRFDTRTADVYLSASITPDQREVIAALGEKYSDNRLRLFFNRIMEKLNPGLPHRINEFRLPDRGMTQI